MEGGRETRLSSPASRLRRRCRSEGLQHSPYDHLQPQRELYSTDGASHLIQPHSPLMSHLPLNSERTPSVHISSFPPLNGVDAHNGVTEFSGRDFPALNGHNEFPITTAQNGELYMANQCNKNPRRSPTGSPKCRRGSPSKPRRPSPHHRIDRDDRLPKVEELLERMDPDTDYEPKQPLKSILNNPRKSPPPGILKKKKGGEARKEEGRAEGRRRQRAMSESEYHYGGLECQRAVCESNGSRMPVLTTMKRMNDNSGIVYNGVPPTVKRQGSPKSPPSPTYKRQPPSPDYNSSTGYKSNPSSPDYRCSQEYRSYLHTQEFSRHPPTHAYRAYPLPEDYRSQPSPEQRRHPPSPEYRSYLSSHEYKGPPSPGYKGFPSECETRLHPGTVLRTTAIGAHTEAMDTVLSPPIAQVPAAPAQPAGEAARHRKPARARAGKHKGKPAGKQPMRCRRAEHAGDADLNGAEEASEPPLPSPPPPSPPPAPPATDAAALERRETAERAVRQLSDKLSNGAVVSCGKRETASPIPDSLAPCVRLSLFPRVPPYLRFVAHDAAPPLSPPLALAKHLKWKLTTITPIVVKKTLINSGFKLVKSECDTAECPQEETVEWIGIWGKHMKSLMFRAIKDGQKMNHFPGSFQIGRKDRLWRNLQKLVARHGIKEFGIMPKTYVLPHDMKILKREWEKYAARNEKWIIKPPASARGTGIAVVSRWAEIPKKKSVVVQRYIAKPYLINGSKFDLRLYVLLTSVHPLKIYLYNQGLARFASVKYTEEVSSLHDRYMHLTNYSINRLSKNYAQNEDPAACQGHKWTLQALLQYLKRERGVNTTALWESLKELVIKTIISGEGSIRSLTDANITSRYNCYELFGIDVLLDEELKPWLLEVNISPSLHSSSSLDLDVKGPLVAAVLNLAQFHVPSKTNLEGPNKEKHTGKYVRAGVPYDSRLYTVYLSKEERDKHIIYTKMEDRDEYLADILSTLTPDDVRHLVQAEDELTAMASAEGMQRIFPTAGTHKYLGFLPAPRYYNRLLDAWECKYRNDRAPGINLLRSLCDLGYHLEVPPVPLKNDVDEPEPESDCARESCASLVSLEVVAAPAGAPGAPGAPGGGPGLLRAAVRA